MFVPNSRARVGSPSITGAANPNPLAGIESHRTASALPLNQKVEISISDNFKFKPERSGLFSALSGAQAQRV